MGVVTQTTWAPACTSERYRSSLRRTASAEFCRSVTSTAISATPAMFPSGSCEGNQENAHWRSSSRPGVAVTQARLPGAS